MARNYYEDHCHYMPKPEIEKCILRSLKKFHSYVIERCFFSTCNEGATSTFHNFHFEKKKKKISFQKMDLFSKNRLSVFDCLECYSFFAKERLSNVFQKTFIITESANSDFLRDPCNQTKVKLYTSICR